MPTQVHIKRRRILKIATRQYNKMTNELDKFMSELMTSCSGSPSNTTIISDNAKMPTTRSTKRLAPKRSRSMPIDRWDVLSGSEYNLITRRPISPKSDSPASPGANGTTNQRASNRISRWESLTGGGGKSTEGGRQGNNQSLVVPTRTGSETDLDKFPSSPSSSSLDKAPQFVTRTQTDVFIGTSSLPVSLRSLPY